MRPSVAPQSGKDRRLLDVRDGRTCRAPDDLYGGGSALDRLLDPAQAKATCHEFFADGAASAALIGVLLGLQHQIGGGRPLLWVRHVTGDYEAGLPYPAGIAEFGLDPARIVLVAARDVLSALQAGLDAARALGLRAIVIEVWGAAKPLDLTATRRLVLAAEKAGTTVLLARLAATAGPSAIRNRWHVAPASSRALAANAPGHPAFRLSLLRHRAGFTPATWRLEWNRDQRHFASEPANTRHFDAEPGAGTALSRPVVSASFGRADAATAGHAGRRRAG